MAKSSAERQRAYRERHFVSIEGGRERLCIDVSVGAKARLERLANYYGKTQRGVIELLLDQAEKEVTRGLSGTEYALYAEKKPLPDNV
jgi:macrodomain Ter protein organizer (MatP/YcbG family)